MKRKISNIGSVTAVLPNGEKRRRNEVIAQFYSKHRKVIERASCLKTYVDSGNEEGLVNELRRVLRQNINRKKGQKAKLDFSSKVRGILYGSTKGEALDSNSVKDFYEALLCDDSRPESVVEGESDCIDLFTCEELRECLKYRSKGAACGIDRVSKAMLNAIKKFETRFEYVHALLNAFLIKGVPKGMKVALVTLIPKIQGAKDPAQFRPVSVTSLVYRLYSRLLSIRFYNAVGPQISSSQAGYRKGVNGCSKNLAILRSILGEGKVENRNLAVASVDVSKAFDSVSHVAIKQCLERLRMPDYLRKACLDTLDQNVLQFKGLGVSVKGLKGVPQGLPLSGYLFIATIDQAVKAMDDLLPYETSTGESIGALCLVDDLLVFSTSKANLEMKLIKLRSLLSESGWRLNAAKSYAYARVKKGSRMQVEKGTIKLGEGQEVKLIPSNEKFRYLGVSISGGNCLRDNSKPILSKLKDSLKKLETANLSVVQKIRAIREIIIPQQCYRLSNVSSVSIWNFKYKNTSAATQRRTNLTRLYANLDRMIARTVKSVLRIPQTGVNVSYFYLNESRGGLGLHRLEVLIPCARIKLRAQMNVSVQMQELLDKYHFNDNEACIRLLQKHHLDVENLSKDARVDAMVKGARRGLIGKSLVIPSKREMVVPLLKRSGGLGFSSFRLQRAVRFRLNCLPTNSRMSIVNPNVSNRCRHGCRQRESLAHLLNDKRCGTLNDLWTRRHNKIVAYLFGRFSKLKKPGTKLALELGTGSFRPDLVLFNDQIALVLEVAVRWGSGQCLNEIFEIKRAKYSSIEATAQLKSKLNELSPSKEDRKVTVIPLVFSVHGSFYDPGVAIHQFYAQMTDPRVSKAALMIGAQMAFESSLKYVGSVLGDRALYTNTRIAE